METKDLFKLMTDSKAIPLGLVDIPRDYDARVQRLSEESGPIRVITGPRRAGKSLILKKLARNLTRSGTPPENIIFLNFEHDLATPYVSLSGLRAIYDQAREHCRAGAKVHLFLDEVQLISGWERFVRTIYDAGEAELYITGSNSKLLSSELASTIGGRVIELECLPFSFCEYLKSQHIVADTPLAIAESNLLIQQHLSEFLLYGGFPEALMLRHEDKLSFRDSLIERVIVRDILSRYRIEKPELLLKLVQYLRRSVCGLTSLRSLERATNVHPQTIANYLQYLENGYIVSRLLQQPFKAKDAFRAQAKYYFVDNLFISGADESALVENLVFSELLRRNPGFKAEQRCFCFARDTSGREVDFLVPDREAIQVTVELNDDNFDREIKPLLLVADYLPSHAKKVIVARRIQLFKNTIPKEIELRTLPEFLLLPDLGSQPR